MDKFNIGDKVITTKQGGWYEPGEVFTLKERYIGEWNTDWFVEEKDTSWFISERNIELCLKSLLTNGRRVKLRNGEMYTVIDRFLVKPLYNPITEELVGMAIDNVLSENLTHKYGSEYDVVNIYERYNNNVALYFCHNLITDLIWQREEKTAKQLQLEALQKQAQDVAEAIKKLQDEE